MSTFFHDTHTEKTGERHQTRRQLAQETLSVAIRAAIERERLLIADKQAILAHKIACCDNVLRALREGGEIV